MVTLKRFINIVIIVLVLGVDFNITGLNWQGLTKTWASQKSYQPLSDQHATAGHEGGETDGDHHDSHGAPVSYYVYWVVLLLILAPVLKHNMALHKLHKAVAHHETPHEGTHDHHLLAPLAISKLLICLVIIMFLMENFSSLAHYHESVSSGLVKFVVKISTGALIMLYGLSFRHD